MVLSCFARSARRSRRREKGFTLLETMIAGTVLTIAALGHSASVVATHTMNRTTEDYGVAMETLGRFVESLRADPDWAGLYARLRPYSQETSGDASLSQLGAAPNLPTYPVGTYLSEFDIPSTLGTVTFLVQVPSTSVGAVAALRENATAPRYGLPYDLNGDGTLDGASRNGDYDVLPVVARIRWQRKGQSVKEAVLATWLKGER